MAIVTKATEENDDQNSQPHRRTGALAFLLELGEPEVNTRDEADRWMTLLMFDLEEMRKG